MSRIATILTSIMIISLFVFGFFYFFVNTKTPAVSIQKISVYQAAPIDSRNQHSILHFNTSNDEDAFFALGFMHAQDRLWQMEFQRHIAKGTLGMMFGDSSSNQSNFFHKFGLYHAAEAAWNALDPKTKSLFHHYVLGINSFLRQGKLSLPFKIFKYTPEPWTDVDSILWQKLMAWDLKNNWRENLENEFIAKQIGKDQPSLLLTQYPPSIKKSHDE